MGWCRRGSVSRPTLCDCVASLSGGDRASERQESARVSPLHRGETPPPRETRVEPEKGAVRPETPTANRELCTRDCAAAQQRIEYMFMVQRTVRAP